MRLKHIINKILLSLFTVTSITFGQTFEISGTIKDESGKKISNARLTLYSSKYQFFCEQTAGFKTDVCSNIKEDAHGKSNFNII